MKVSAIPEEEVHQPLRQALECDAAAGTCRRGDSTVIIIITIIVVTTLLLTFCAPANKKRK